MSRRRAQARQQRRRSQRVTRSIWAAFLLSGFAGLMHQVIWAKLLVQLIGSTAYAQAVVLAVFMGGLAIGATWLGRWVDRRERPLHTYVVLEFAIGGYCLALPLIVKVAGMGYVALASAFFEAAALKLAFRFAMASLVVLVPAVLMGGTLPTLARHLVRSVEQTRRQVANLYSLNSLGAVLGAGFAGFVALPLLGLYASLILASVLNLASGALLWGPARGEGRATPRRRKAPEPGSPAFGPEQYAVALLALGLSGFAALGYEVLFSRIIALAFGASTYSFSVMLMSFIAGIALGSAIVARVRVRDPLWLFGASQLAVVAALLVATPLISRLPYWITLMRIGLQDVGGGFELYQLGKAALCLLVLLLPTTCLGFSFPLVAQIQVRHPGEVASRVGSTYACNTIGNVLGAIGTSLWLLPLIGVLGAFHFNLALNFVAGVCVLLVSRETGVARRAAAVGVAAAITAVYAGAGAGWLDPVNTAVDHLKLRAGPDPQLAPELHARHPAASFEAWKRRYVVSETPEILLFLHEDSHATVVVAGEAAQAVLFVNGKPDASNNPSDLVTQLLLGHAPMFLAPHARSLLVIGHGSGITAGSALLHPIERADVVEISRGVLKADSVFAEHNYGVLTDPRTRVYEEDGLSFLRTVPRSYDVIISEPSNPWIAGVAELFTVEFFESVRDRLNPGGVFTFWFHAYSQSDASVELVLRSLHSVFPHVMLFSDDDFGNAIAIASSRRVEPDFAAMERRYRRPSIRRDLARTGIPSFEAFLSHHRISADRFPRIFGSGPHNTVGRQRLEYDAPRSFFSGENSLLLDRFDPLVNGRGESGGILLDRYVAHRAALGDPVSWTTLTEAANYAAAMGGYGPNVARALMARARGLALAPAPGAR